MIISSIQPNKGNTQGQNNEELHYLFHTDQNDNSAD